MTIVDTGTPPSTDPIGTPPDGGRRARRVAEPSPSPETPKPPRKPISPVRGSIAWVLATICLLTVWFVLYAVVLTPFQEQRKQSELYSQYRYALSQQVATVGDNPDPFNRGVAIPPGTPVALISAPSIGVQDTVVVEGTASGDLMSGPGHKRNTVLPGQAGISVIFGRASLFGGPFGALSSARKGDEIRVITGQGEFTYVVDGIRRARDPLPQPLADGAGRLVLVSALGDGRLGSLDPTGTLYLDSTLKGRASPTRWGSRWSSPRPRRRCRATRARCWAWR